MRVTSVPQLAAAVSDRSERLIAVDGLLGSGKSTLSRALASSLECPMIGCDVYLEPDKGTFLGALRYGDIRRELTRALSTATTVILEGVCIRHVMLRLTVDPSAAVTVYVKHLAATGCWEQADELQPMTADLRRAVCALTGEDYLTPTARREVRDYHSQYRPHEVADIVYEWIEDGIEGKQR